MYIELLFVIIGSYGYCDCYYEYVFYICGVYIRDMVVFKFYLLVVRKFDFGLFYCFVVYFGDDCCELLCEDCMFIRFLLEDI